MSKRGRPTLYNRATANAIINMFRNGKTKAEISKIMGIDLSTMEDWYKAYPDFLRAIRKSQEIYIKEGAEKALKDLVEGTKVKEKKVEKIRVWVEEKNKYEMIAVKEEIITKEIPPNFHAIKFTLLNRAKNRWKHQQNFTIDATNLPSQELVTLAKEALREIEKGKDK